MTSMFAILWPATMFTQPIDGVVDLSSVVLQGKFFTFLVVV